MTGAAPRPRAAIVVTGRELVRGDRQDRNGPFIARELVALGLEPSRITIVGDDPGELAAAFAHGLEADLCVVSGGLGPTHDDRTVEMLARTAGLELVVDPELEARSRASRAPSPNGSGGRTPTSRSASPSRRRSRRERVDRPCGHGARVRRPCGRARVVVVLPGPPARAAAALAARARATLVRGVIDRAQPPGSTRAPVLRCERVGSRARPRRGRRGRRRRRGDDLRARLRDPRRPVRRARARRSEPPRSARAARALDGTSSPRTSGRSRRSCSPSAARGA